MNKYLLSLTICIFIVSSCASVEVTTNNVKNEKESPLEVDENQKFLDFLEADWEKTLSNNPLFATYTGDKRFNDKINPNTIDQFEKDRLSDLESLKKLNSIDSDKLNPDNKLNYNLKKFDIESDLNLSQFPIYYLRLNQRGGIQSFYETGNRLVYQSKKDYYDWLSRLNQFSENILNFLEINQQGLQNGYTQPKLVTQGVISQIDAIINSDINSNPYLKVFIDADETLLSQNEKLELINDAKELIINKINPDLNKEGNIFDINGNQIGVHKGIVNYTIGQRKGVGVGGQEKPLYVKEVNKKQNYIVLAPYENLQKNKIFFKNINLLDKDILNKTLIIIDEAHRVCGQERSRQEAQGACQSVQQRCVVII